jgi:hypothetical protein
VSITDGCDPSSVLCSSLEGVLFSVFHCKLCTFSLTVWCLGVLSCIVSRTGSWNTVLHCVHQWSGYPVLYYASTVFCFYGLLLCPPLNALAVVMSSEGWAFPPSQLVPSATMWPRGEKEKGITKNILISDMKTSLCLVLLFGLVYSQPGETRCRFTFLINTFLSFFHKHVFMYMSINFVLLATVKEKLTFFLFEIYVHIVLNHFF